MGNKMSEAMIQKQIGNLRTSIISNVTPPYDTPYDRQDSECVDGLLMSAKDLAV